MLCAPLSDKCLAFRWSDAGLARRNLHGHLVDGHDADLPHGLFNYLGAWRPGLVVVARRLRCCRRLCQHLPAGGEGAGPKASGVEPVENTGVTRREHECIGAVMIFLRLRVVQAGAVRVIGKRPRPWVAGVDDQVPGRQRVQSDYQGLIVGEEKRLAQNRLPAIPHLTGR